MPEAKRLAAQVADAVGGDPWFGRSVLAALDCVDAATAQAHASGVDHSIWQIVLHLTAWARETERRVRGGSAGLPTEGDWPEVGAFDAESWETALAELRIAHEDLVQSLGLLPDSVLDAIPEGAEVDALGQPVSMYRVAAGTAQHAAYHSGQIAVLRGLIVEQRRPV